MERRHAGVMELHVARLEAGALHGVDVSAWPHAVFLIVEVSCLAFFIVEVSQPQGGAKRALASPGSAATSSRASRSAIAVRRGGVLCAGGMHRCEAASPPGTDEELERLKRPANWNARRGTASRGARLGPRPTCMLFDDDAGR